MILLSSLQVNSLLSNMNYQESERLVNYRKKLTPLKLPIQKTIGTAELISSNNNMDNYTVSFTNIPGKGPTQQIKTEQDLEIIDYLFKDLHVTLTEQQTSYLTEQCVNYANYLEHKKTFLFNNYFQDPKLIKYNYENNCLEHIVHLYRLGISLTEEQREDLKLPSKTPYFELERIFLQNNFLAKNYPSHKLTIKQQRNPHIYSNKNSYTLENTFIQITTDEEQLATTHRVQTDTSETTSI